MVSSAAEAFDASVIATPTVAAAIERNRMVSPGSLCSVCAVIVA
jgi:hypothetical protein